MINQYEKAFDKLFERFPNNYASEKMRTLWLDTWSQHPIRVISRTVDTVIRELQQFPSIDEFMVMADKETKRQARIARQEQMANCDCYSGFIETEPEMYRPCESCLPETYERWTSGEYEPQHGRREEREPLGDKFKTSLERLRQTRKDIQENRKR